MALTSKEYHDYQNHLSDLRVEYLQQQMHDNSNARMRSLLLRAGKRTLVTRSSSLLRNGRRPRPEPQVWIEHVRDGVPLTEHGAQLLASLGQRGGELSAKCRCEV